MSISNFTQFMKNGFFISCIMNREDKAFREFITKVSSFGWCGIQSVSFPVTNFKAELARELKMFRSYKYFSLLDEYKSVMLIENKTNLPSTHLYNKMREMDMKFFNVQRILPLDLITSLESPQIASYIMNSKINGRFKILFEGRLCCTKTKEAIFKIIIPLVKSKVDLVSPEFIIVVQAFKKHIGISVVKGESRNFNFSNKDK